MAVANPGLQEDWDQQKNKTVGSKRIPWRERMRRWIKAEVREGELESEESVDNEVGDKEDVEEDEKKDESAEEDLIKDGEEEDETLALASEDQGGDDWSSDGYERVDEEEERQNMETVESRESDEDEEETEAGQQEREVQDEGAAEIHEERDPDEDLQQQDGQYHQGWLNNPTCDGDENQEDRLEEDEDPAGEDNGLGSMESYSRGSDSPRSEDENLHLDNLDMEEVHSERQEYEEEEGEGEEEGEEEEGEGQGEEEEGEGQGEEGGEEGEGEEEEEEEGEGEEGEGEGEEEEEEEEKEDLVERSWSDDVSLITDWTSQETDKERDECEEWSYAKESSTMDEEFQDDLLEEESTDDEEEQQSMVEGEDDEDQMDEDDLKIYSVDDYAASIFLTLTEFKDSSIFTDLILNTADGGHFEVHFLVMAAVSSLFWRNLNENKTSRKDRDPSSRAQRFSLSLGPDVDSAGLEAVVEFAYTGLISSLNLDNVSQIKMAAQKLGAPRVLDVCTTFLQSAKTGNDEKKERMSVKHQLLISLQVVKQLWLDGVGCDVVLDTVDGSLPVHRLVLAVTSDYFRSMFTLAMKESRQQRVTLPLLSAAELEVLVSCSYSGVLQLGWKSIFEVTGTALQLQHQPALSLCFDFLRQEINPYTCLDAVSFAESYQVPQVLEVANDFILRQFQKVALTSKFKDLPGRQLFKYLKSRSLCVSSELVVFRAIVSWIQAKPKTRIGLAKVLMKTVHFPLMTFKEFKEVRSNNMWSDSKLGPLYEEIFQDFCSDGAAPRNQCRVYLPKESLVLTGGERITDDLGRRSISKELWFGNSLRNLTGIRKAMEWRRLGEMPEPARFGHEVAVLKGQLYVFGGKKYYGNGDILSCVSRFDPRQNTWESLADMLERRSSFSVVVTEGKILAIGGQSDPDFRDSVEQYCPSTDSWSFMMPLDLPLSGHVAKCLHRKIFVCGGRNNDYPCVDSMFQYHPETGSTFLSNMSRPRAHHCMEILGESLYVVGGISSGSQVHIVDLFSCEVYSPATDSWSTFTSLPVSHVGAASAVLEGKLYVLGGYSQEDYSDTKMVHRYDPATQRWENVGRMPGPNNDISASVMCLPQHFRS